MNATYVIEAAAPADRVAVQALGERSFGAGHRVSGNAAERLLVARADGHVIGFADGAALSDLEPAFHEHADALRRRLSPGSNGLGLVRSVAVEPSWQGRGVARKLLHALIVRLRADGCRCLLTRAWVRPDGRVPAALLLQRAGFAAVLTVPEFWRSAQRRQGFGCTLCDPKPCRCGAVIYAAGC